MAKKRGEEHIGRRFYTAVQKRELDRAADYLSAMVRRYLSGLTLENDEALRVFLSAHLVSAFDLAGGLRPQDMAPFESIIAGEIARFGGALPTEQQADDMVHRILSRIGSMFEAKLPRFSGRMEEVVAYVNRHYSDPELSVNRLAEIFGVSVSYLSRAFRQTMGVGLNDHIHAVRLEASRRLLGETDLPIREIAERTGFSSSGSFIRAYRSREGMTPGAYREQLRRMAP